MITPQLFLSGGR